MSQEAQDRVLLLVYNEDSGIFNAVADAVHKVWSPETYDCHLCALTYGAVSMRDEWASFLRELNFRLRFLHRNEFQSKFPDLKIELPAILLIEAARVKILVSAEKINQCCRLNELKDTLRWAAFGTTG